MYSVQQQLQQRINAALNVVLHGSLTFTDPHIQAQLDVVPITETVQQTTENAERELPENLRALMGAVPSTNPSFGDYQFNGALPMAKHFKVAPWYFGDGTQLPS